jgi:hypothetical protein
MGRNNDSEFWGGKGVTDGGSGIIWSNMTPFAWSDWKRPQDISIRIASMPARIPITFLLSTSLERYRYSNLLGHLSTRHAIVSSSKRNSASGFLEGQGVRESYSCPFLRLEPYFFIQGVPELQFFDLW